ncbi:hypothetical protein [Tepidibacillus fermentans]|uniref:Uncharacterized protein n=1 Tax=Tepidibacillus fermentans TaxID=1281767 RepID=A0A4R3KBG6_9BACI|nr:hypothetical protein [Tepidibacillus fermentans]TCS80365.1 hypothetical protein EDD72_11732 [Tepidibacillus fermentans]
MKFIRLQSKKYEINENSKSFEWGFPDLHAAMHEDISFVSEQYEGIPNHQFNKKFENMLFAEDKETENKLLEELWEEYVGWGMALPGVSCYRFEEGKENEAAKKLYDYFLQRDPEALESDEYYVLIFEGDEFFSKGHNGEEVAVFRKEIERVETKEFFSRYLIDEEWEDEE